MKQIKTFEADDGIQFSIAAECKEYERQAFIDRLKNLPYSRVSDALDRTDIDLADAFERAGNIIAAKRRASGELKRVKKSGDPAAKMDAIKKNLKVIS